MNSLPRATQVLVDRLATARSVSPEEAVTLALEEALARSNRASAVKSTVDRDEFVRRLEKISQLAGALPVRDPRSADEILGYDEFGIPS